MDTESKKKASNPNLGLMRYIELDKYVDILSTKTLFFPRYDNLGDKFEGSLGDIHPGNFLRELNLELDEGSRGPTDIRQGLESIETLLYQSVLRDFTFISCWHKSEVESALMWRVYSQKGVIIKTDLMSLKTSLSMDAQDYKNEDVFRKEYTIENSNRYEILTRIDDVKYDRTNEKPVLVGLDRYFSKQKPYKSEKELRIVLQLNPESKFNFRNIDYERINRDFHQEQQRSESERAKFVANLFYKSIFQMLDSHRFKLMYNNEFCASGVRCSVDPNTLIKEVIISPFAHINGTRTIIETLNCEFELETKVTESSIKAKTSPTKFEFGFRGGPRITIMH